DDEIAEEPARELRGERATGEMTDEAGSRRARAPHDRIQWLLGVERPGDRPVVEDDRGKDAAFEARILHPSTERVGPVGERTTERPVLSPPAPLPPLDSRPPHPRPPP